MYTSMSQVKQAFPVFFSRDTMRFFNSRVESELYRNRYFITSEQFVGSDGYKAPRKYTIREITEHGINTVGEVNQIGTLQEARNIIKTLR